MRMGPGLGRNRDSGAGWTREPQLYPVFACLLDPSIPVWFARFVVWSYVLCTLIEFITCLHNTYGSVGGIAFVVVVKKRSQITFKKNSRHKSCNAFCLLILIVLIQNKLQQTGNIKKSQKYMVHGRRMEKPAETKLLNVFLKHYLQFL